MKLQSKIDRRAPLHAVGKNPNRKSRLINALPQKLRQVCILIGVFALIQINGVCQAQSTAKSGFADFVDKWKRAFANSTDSAKPEESADPNTISVTGWKVNRDPFSTNSTGSPDSIIARAALGQDSYANIIINCNSDGHPQFIVGVANAQLDIHSKQADVSHYVGPGGFMAPPIYSHQAVTVNSFLVNARLDGYEPQELDLPVESPNKFSFSFDDDPRKFAGPGFFLIGFAIAGERKTLRIPLNDPIVARFFSQCAQVASSANKNTGENNATQQEPANNTRQELPWYVVSGVPRDSTGNPGLLNVRAGKGMDFPVITKLQNGYNRVKIIRVEPNGTTEWAYIWFAEHFGWVAKKYLLPE